MPVKIKRKKACPEQRRRGAPVGNQNAVKHGYYSRALDGKDKFDFNLAADLNGVTEEIALLRFEMKKAISSGDINRLVPLSKTALALEKLIRTHHKIFVARQQGFENAMENVVRHTLLPMLGPDSAVAFLKWHYQNKPVPAATLEAIKETINAPDEADLTYNKKQKIEAN